MSDDMFPWEEVFKYPISVVLVLQQMTPEQSLDIRTGFIEDDDGLHLPEKPLDQNVLASDQIVRMAKPYIDADPRWAQKDFVAFFDSLARETPRVIRLAYSLCVPVNVNVSDKLQWKTHHEVATSRRGIVGDHDRIFTTAFNFR